MSNLQSDLARTAIQRDIRATIELSDVRPDESYGIFRGLMWALPMGISFWVAVVALIWRI